MANDEPPGKSRPSDEDQQNRTTDRWPKEIDPQSTLNRQYQVTRHLNDELFRTIRIHILLGGVLATGISILVSTNSPTVFYPSANSILLIAIWGISALIGIWSGLIWVLRLSSLRLNYSQLSLFDGVDEVTAQSSKGPLQKIKRVYWEPLDRDIALASGDECDQTVVPSKEAIERNDRLIRSKEQYVDSVQAHLFTTFIVMVVGIIGTILV